MIEIPIKREDIGFGFTITGENPPTVESIAPKSPADYSGLKKDDLIVSINGLSVKNAPHQVVINFLRSKEHITMVVSRDNSGCKYCGYPTLRRVNRDTQPIMLTTLLYINSREIPHHDIGLHSIYTTIEQLNLESHYNTIVTMEANSQGITISNAAQKCIAFHNILSLRYCGMWPQDKRYFGLITCHGTRATCHVFMTDITYNEKYLSIFGHAGLTVTSADGTVGHKHRIRVATYIVRGFASVYCNHNDIQVDQTRVSRGTSHDTADTESVIYDCGVPDNDRDLQQVQPTIPYDADENTCSSQQTTLSDQLSAVVGESMSMGDGGRISLWAKGFDKLLEDPDGIICFQEFLKKEYADENIKFWRACKTYEGISDCKQRRETASQIISEYLVSGAPNPINIDARGREDVVKNCHLAQPNLFKLMQKQIYNLMMYGKYWQFTRGQEYLHLLEQEKMGHPPLFKHNHKEGKRRNVVTENTYNNNNNRNFFSSFFWRMKRDRPAVEQHVQNNARLEQNNTKQNRSKHVDNAKQADIRKHHVLLEMPNCTLRRAYYDSSENVRECIERSLINSGVNWTSYHVCIKSTGEVIDVNKLVSQFSNRTLSFLNTPTFHVTLYNKTLQFCTSHGKTLIDVCRGALNEHNIDINSTILFEPASRTYVRLDTQSILVANKLLEVRDVTQRSTSVPRLSRKTSDIKSCSKHRSVHTSHTRSLDSNLESETLSSDDEPVHYGRRLVRSQSELEFFELLNRVQCDRLDNQRCSHPDVLENLSQHCQGFNTYTIQSPIQPAMEGDDIDYC